MGLSKQVPKTVSSVKEDLETLFFYNEPIIKIIGMYVLLYTFVAQPMSIFINNKNTRKPTQYYIRTSILRIHRMFFRDP